MKHPTSYGPDKAVVAFWALLCCPPALVCGYLFATAPTLEMGSQLLLTLVFPVAPILFASRFRATFASSEFIYRRWGPTVRVPYSQIERIDVTNVTPVGKQPIGAFIITTGGEKLPFWPKLFSREAVNRFLALAD